MGILWHSPLESTGVFLGLLFLVLLTLSALSAGAQMCPAAASSTIYTSVGMSLSYVGQVLFYGEMPGGSTIAGAVFMLISVIMMASARKLYTRPASAETVKEDISMGSTVPQPSAVEDTGSPDDADHESLASFCASEFSGVSLRERASARLQRMGVSPQVVGLAIA